MDVRCEKCLTEYEFDDAKVTEAGVTVKCTTCGHVFKVRKAAPEPASFMAPPASSPGFRGDEFAPESSQIDRVREWKIRQPAGNIFTCRELTTLQKWIVERKVSRDDQISLTGDQWKRLGDIPELAGFFLVVDQANKAAFLEQQMQGPAQGGPTVMSAPTAVLQPRSTTGGYQLGSMPTQAKQQPAWVDAPSDDALEDDLKAIKKRGPGVWIGLLVVAAAAGGGAWFYLHSQGGTASPLVVSPTPTPAPAPTPAPTTAANTSGSPANVAPPTPAPTPPPVVAAPADAGTAAPAAVVASSGGSGSAAAPPHDGGAAPAPAVIDAGSPQPAVAAKPPPATTGTAPAKPPPSTGGASPRGGAKSFDALMAAGATFERREKFQAALSAYNQAIELEPGSAEAWSGKGQALTDMGSYGPSEDAFRKALSISPRFSDAEYGLAFALENAGKKAEAIKQYKKFLEDHPDDDNAPAARNAISKLAD